MAQLLLHCGSYPIDEAELSQLDPPVPQGPGHRPYPFADFLAYARRAAADHGLVVTDTHLGLSANRNRFFGILECESPSTDHTPLISLRASHDKSLAQAVGAGFRTLVCDNTSFITDHVLRAKHTGDVQTRVQVKLNAVMGRLLFDFVESERQFEHWKNTLISKAVADAAITQMIRSSIIPAAKAAEVIRINDAPTHEEYIPGSVYALFQATTEALKPPKPLADPGRYQHRTVALSALCNELSAYSSEHTPEPLDALNETDDDDLLEVAA